MKNINESFEIHETLNPKLWDTTTNKLLPEIRKKLVEIVKTFEDYVEAPMDICDVQLVGSNASYNYTNNSDLDVHLIASFESVNPELLQTFYDIKRQTFNKQYDITLREISIELYIQDVRANITSNGIYSLCDDEWIKEPKQIKSATKHNTEKELDKWRSIIADAVESRDFDRINQTLNTLYLIRHNSIAVEGEFGKGNQLFKDIRAEGLIDVLKSELIKAKSVELSLESLSEGQLINRIRNIED